jgi:methyl-accepting chemotaxis protein
MKKEKLKSIKVKLLYVPLMIVLIGVIGMAIISSIFVRNSLLNEMRTNGFIIMENIIDRISDNIVALETINTTLEDKIRVAANIVIRNQNNLSNELLNELKKDLDVDELHWFDKDGKIIYSTVPGYLNWVTPNTHPLYAVKIGQKELMEEVREDAEFGQFLKYGAVRHIDGTFVQVGIIADTVQELTQRFRYQNIVEDLASGNNINYALFLDTNAIVLASSYLEEIGIQLDDEGSITAAVNKKTYADEFFDETENVKVYDVLLPVIIDDEHLGAINIGFSMNTIESSIRNNIFVFVITGIIAFVLLASILFLISSDAVKSIKILKNHMIIMSSGDFSKDIESKYLERKDEFGQMANALNELHVSLSSIVKNIK